MAIQFHDLIENVPHSPGVYQMFDATGDLLYVGKAKDLWNRLHQYVNLDALSYHKRLMRTMVARVEIITTKTESDALILESDLIKNKHPKYNIMLTDDKMYPMLMLSADPFPRLVKFRGRITPRRDVFGPYPSVGALNDTIKLVQRVAQIRTCTNTYMNNRTRPCLLHQIGRCSAPCMHTDSDSAFGFDYKSNVSIARQILSGDIASVTRELSEQMDAAAAKMDYERAATLRDQIRAMSETVARGKKDMHDADYFALDTSGDAPVLAYESVRNGAIVRNQIIHPKNATDMTPAEIMEQAVLECRVQRAKEKKVKIITNVKTPVLSELCTISSELLCRPDDAEIHALLSQISTNRRVFSHVHIDWPRRMDDLGKWLNMKIDRVDVFDNSHLFGTNNVGAMIVFGRDGFAKHEYRHYKLENEKLAGNDIGMMTEFLTRTYQPLTSSPPHALTTNRLIIVDGGRAQWNAAMAVMKKLHLSIPVVGVVKGVVRNGDEHFILPDGTEDTTMAKDSPLFLLLRAVRDEAHRFVITFHRARRAKSAGASALDDIDGIGPSRRRALLHQFGSVAGIINADIQTIARTPGISKSVAEKIYGHLHPDIA